MNDILTSFRKRALMLLPFVLCYFLNATVGCTMVWGSPMLKKLNHTEDNPLGRKITDTENSFLASVGIPGMVIGSFSVGILAERLGRKTMMIIIAIPSSCSLLILAFSKSITLFCLARAIDGFSVGAVMPICPMYICELADPKIRGTLCACIIISLTIGNLITYILGPLLTFRQFHLIIVVIPITFMVLFTIFGKESPYYYLNKDLNKARTLLRELRGIPDVSEELEEMQKYSCEHEKGTIMDVLKSKTARKALLLGVGLMTFFALTGSCIFSSYTEFIFDTAGGTWSGEEDTLVIGICTLFTAIATSFVVDHFDRKSLLTFSYFGNALSEAVLGLYFVFQKNGTDVSALGWLPLTSFVIYSIFFGLGAGPITQMLMGELFPMRIKGVAMAILQIYSSSLGFLLSYSFIKVQKTIGLGTIFLIFSCSCFCAVPFSWFFMIETKGKTLNEVQKELGGVETEIPPHSSIESI